MLPLLRLGRDAPPHVPELPVPDRRQPAYGRRLLWPDRPPRDIGLAGPAREHPHGSRRRHRRGRGAVRARRDRRRRDREGPPPDRGRQPSAAARRPLRREASTPGDGRRPTAPAHEHSDGRQRRCRRPRNRRRQHADPARRSADRDRSPSGHDPTTSDPDHSRFDPLHSPSDQRPSPHECASVRPAHSEARNRRTHIRKAPPPRRRPDTSHPSSLGPTPRSEQMPG